MKIKSSKYIRKYIWEKPEGGNLDATIDYNFVGSYARNHDKIVHGFFKMFHGIKPDIAGYLPSILKIAEDGQAIYEFIQNAVDCNSTHFFIFFNEKYFLAINNGKPFDIEGLQSILNIAQTTKKDPESIGRFGIGFKLAHRLVGKNEGTDELVNQYKGPVLFSWSKLEDLHGLLNCDVLEPIIPNKKNDKNFENAPYLLKLILTNFPAEPNEKVRDLHYNPRILFPEEELNELINYLNENFQLHADSLKMNVLNQGSLFFIKLGEGKSELLEKDYSELVNGIQYSMNTLKRLQKVYINNEDIGKIPLTLLEGTIKQGTEAFERISPEYKEYDIKFALGYHKVKFGNEKSYEKLKTLKEQPNIYKYFPMGDEVNKLCFIVHCDSFSNEANRRKLQQDNINKNLFPEIVSYIIEKLNSYKQTDRDHFLSLYASILCSDMPMRENNKWLRPIFFDYLLSYIRTNIPTSGDRYSNKAIDVKINRLSLGLNLTDFGLGHIQWFEWNNINDQYLIDEAISSEKLGIESWDIRDIVENANIESINKWIENCNEEIYDAFLTELENSNLRQKTKEKICTVKLFKFSNGKYYSFNELVKPDFDYNKRILTNKYHYSNVIIHTKKTWSIKLELGDMGFITSKRNLSDFPSIFSCISKPPEKALYDLIAGKCKTNKLTAQQRKTVFLNFIREETKFEGIAEGTLKELCLFSDNLGVIKPINELVDSNLETPTWINPYKITAVENFTELKQYLIPEKSLFKKVIIPKWDEIIANLTDIEEFYSKVCHYYGLEDTNIPLRTQKFVYTKSGFLLPGQTFFNSKMISLEKLYIYFQQAIELLYGLPTPEKSIAPFLQKEPFILNGSKFIGGRKIEPTTLDVYQIKAVLSFCRKNEEQFFKNFLIKKEAKVFKIVAKTTDSFQITLPDENAKKFITKNCANNLVVLPSEFHEFKEEDGIVKTDELYSLILDSVDVNLHKKTLVNIVKYKAKHQLINKLNEFIFNADKIYTKSDYEFQILELACNLNELKEIDYQKIREKVKIKTGNITLSLSEIPPIDNKITIDGIQLSLSDILPDIYQNSSIISNLIGGFIKLGLPKEKLYTFFGINTEPEPDKIYSLLADKYVRVQNAQQLAFLILYDKNIETIDFKKFEVQTFGEIYNLDYLYYIDYYSFIQPAAILAEQFKRIEKLITLPISAGKETEIIKKPYFTDSAFVCPYLEEDLSDENRICLFQYLYKEWKNPKHKTIIKTIDWSKINEVETEKLLGFNPKYSVFPNSYACKTEQLPKYLSKWVGSNITKIDFISDLGVWTEGSVVIDLRKFLKGDIADFANNRLSQETKFNGDEKMLFNTFNWLKENELQLTKKKQYETFGKVVQIINDNRKTSGDLLILEDFDLVKLEEKSKIWKTVGKFSILLYDRKLPVTVKLDETEDYIFYNFNEHDFAVNEEKIYLNGKTDKKNTLQKVASDDNNDFSFEDLWVLFSENLIEAELAKKDAEIARLKNQLQQKPNAKLGGGNDNSISKDDQKEANREAKAIVKEHLESKGFSFTKGINGYSAIDGVIKDGVEFPLVVKSYKWREVPFEIGANEWLQLMKPNSMFWVHFGNRKLGCLKLNELLRKQDKLTISFGTENLDVDGRLNKFAELLHYFSNVHFDFNSIKSEDYRTADNLNDYRFDERKAEMDLSSDSDSQL